MPNKYVVLTIILFLVNNILIWYQLNSQLVWGWAKGPKALLISCIVGVPITALFWYATKWGYQGFGTLWQTRLIAFATSMMVFPVMTWLYLGEVITLKIGMSILLATAILILQLI